jgi:hypothetical protein
MCHYPGYKGYQGKERNMTESQASLPRHLAEGSENMQKVDPPSGSTQANESFHAREGEVHRQVLELHDLN